MRLAQPAFPSARERAPIECRTEGSQIIVTIISGKPSALDSRRALVTFKSLVANMDRPIWVSDATALVGYETSALTEGRNWFSAFKERKGRQVVLVSEWGIAMMAARAMGVGFGVRITSQSTLPRALNEAKRLLSSKQSSLFP